jgi:hypothetical protein
LTLISGQTKVVTLGPGTFTVTEPQLDSFMTDFSGDCRQTSLHDATGTISAGQNLHCTKVCESKYVQELTANAHLDVFFKTITFSVIPSSSPLHYDEMITKLQLQAIMGYERSI